MTKTGRPVAAAVAGSACISASAVFVKLSGADAGTAAVLRCGLALLVLVPLAWRERRAVGARPPRARLIDAAAGVLLGVDLVFWTQSVADVGAAVATVVLNVQVVVFPLLAWGLTGTRPPARFAVLAPVMLAGVALAGGVASHPETGAHPALGLVYGAAAGVAFAGYLFLMRLGGTAAGPGRGHAVSPVCTASASAAATAAVMGGLWTGVDLDPGLRAWGWLAALALIGQVLAWLLIGHALPRLAPNLGAALLLLQPVLAFVLGLAIGERPTPLQVVGCAVVVAAVGLNTRTGARRRDGTGAAAQGGPAVRQDADAADAADRPGGTPDRPAGPAPAAPDRGPR